MVKIDIEHVYIYGMLPAHHPPKLVARVQTTDGPRTFDVEAIQVELAGEESSELDDEN
ncbi:MAG: hypothetical protein HYX72_11020 [Acidobacteria bacterium]|nr:hypothetical protein [Acidobacteriota bacterium]